MFYNAGLIFSTNTLKLELLTSLEISHFVTHL